MLAAQQLRFDSIWPSAADELLLLAALGDGLAARNALADWKSACGFAKYDDVDFLSTYLLAWVYGNLKRAGQPDPWLAQLAGLHRYHWTRNAASMKCLVELIARMHAGGLQPVLRGGFALLAGEYFSDLGERPLLDAELFVSAADGLLTRRILSGLGWRAVGAIPPVAGWRSENWRGTKNTSIQVHYRWLPKPYPVVGIDRVLRHSRTVKFGGLAVRIPDAADLLLQAVVGGRRFDGDRARQFLWVADAVRIVRRSESQLDWQRLLRESRPLCALQPLRDALRYIRDRFSAQVPDAWLREARQIEIPPAELAPYQRSVRRCSGIAAGPVVARRPWDGYLAAEHAAGRNPSARGMLRYLGWRIATRLHKSRRAA